MGVAFPGLTVSNPPKRRGPRSQGDRYWTGHVALNEEAPSLVTLLPPKQHSEHATN